MNFTKISKHTTFGKILRFPLKLIPPNSIVPILSGSLRGKKWIVGSGIHGCWLGTYEYEKQLAFEKTVTPESVVFDLGGNVGFYTLLASELVGPKGMVYVFEPSKRNLFYLHEHLRINNIRNVSVIEAAVTNETGVATFEKGPNSSMGHLSPEGNILVKTVTLDELISSAELPIPNFIKIDIEGAETKALLGAQSLLAKAHPTLFLALHGEDVRQECYEILEKLEYCVTPIDGRNKHETNEIIAFRKD